MTDLTVLAAQSRATASTPPAPEPPAPEHETWRYALEEVLRDPSALTLHAQPIVELSSGAVAGYETLSRFRSSTITAPPDAWFAAAAHRGVDALLQAKVLSTAVAMRAVLPPDTFLTVNVEPDVVLDPRVSGSLLEHADLGRLVLELTEHTRAGDPQALLELVGQLRTRGALIAMDDAGTGYAGLSQLLFLRPDVVKLDRELITGIDADPVKRALVEVMGDLVGRMDGWVLAEGVETLTELDAVVGLGVALGQGFALARPGLGLPTEIDEAVVDRIRRRAARHSLGEHVLSLVQPARVGTSPQDCDVLLADDGRVRAVRWGGHCPEDPVRWSTPLVVAPSASIADVARRLATRHPADVPAPAVCTDGQGHVLGTIPLADLLLALSRRPNG